ncbi:MAG: SigB/SigF/SigG family RNA polymerase sigma factor [Clostridia bacterium]|jgi:RNA polymerase sporulation-specific sigma factor|nr:SigB/SigF/SigG family RNA polymerase sigma factor [Clostridia bacterium]
MDRLIRDNNGLIWSIVKRFMNRGYEVEDLYQIGCMGFIKSIKRFDTNFEVKLSTYSVPYILGEIKRFIRDDGPIKVSRSIKELNVKINELKKHELLKTGKELTIEEICKELKVQKEDVIIAMESANTIESIDGSVVSENKDGKQLTIFERISTGKNEEEIITNRMVVNQLISELEDREKEIILLRFYKEKTQTEVAKILGISQVQVSRIERKILSSMKMKLTSA